MVKSIEWYGGSRPLGRTAQVTVEFADGYIATGPASAFDPYWEVRDDFSIIRIKRYWAHNSATVSQTATLTIGATLLGVLLAFGGVAAICAVIDWSVR